MFQTATLAEWYKTHGRHTVYARGNDVPLPVPPRELAPLVQISPAKPSAVAAKMSLPVLAAAK